MVQWLPFGLIYPAAGGRRPVPLVGGEAALLLAVTATARGRQAIIGPPPIAVPPARLEITKVAGGPMVSLGRTL